MNAALKALTLAFLMLAGIFAHGATAFADDLPEVPTLNISSQQEADVFARKLVTRYEAEAKQLGITTSELDPVIIVHVGDRPPEHLKWIMLHLEAAKIPAELDLINEEEMTELLTKAKERATGEPTYLTYSRYTEDHRRSVSELFAAALLKTRQVFGLPNGFTAWVKIDRSRRLKVVESALGGFNATLASLSVAYTYYLTEHVQNVQLHAVRAALFVAAWTWWTTFEGRRISELMTQAKVVKENPSGVFKPTHSKLFAFVGNTFRSVIGNAIVQAGAFDLEQVFTGKSLEQNLFNTTVSAFARGWIDDWFSSKMPTLKEDGTIVPDVSKGQWSMRRWLILNSTWNLVYTFGKSISLLNMGGSGAGIVDYIYYSMGAVGMLKLAYDERFNIREKFTRLVSAFTSVNVTLCESLIIGPGWGPGWGPGGGPGVSPRSGQGSR